MLKIWGRISSINVQKVVICANELEIPYERVDAGGKFGVVATPEYKRLNPNSLVPTIEDGDFVLWESNAIVRYLAHTYGSGSLWPNDPRTLADADRWMDWQTTTLNPAQGDAFMQLVRTPPDQRNMAAVAASLKKTEPHMAVLDAHLSGRRYVTGDALTMADIPLACSAHRWLGLPVDDKEPRRHVEAWLAMLRARPAFASVLTLPLT
jgi:glutathione S-transferase